MAKTAWKNDKGFLKICMTEYVKTYTGALVSFKNEPKQGYNKVYLKLLRFLPFIETALKPLRYMKKQSCWARFKSSHGSHLAPGLWFDWQGWSAMTETENGLGWGARLKKEEKTRSR